MELNKEMIENAGFKIDAAGKMRTAGGQLVKKEVAEQVAAGSILSNFSMEDLKKKKARKAATGTADLLTGLNAISPAIALLGVGQTAKIPMPKSNKDGKNPKRAFVMGVVTKLNNLTTIGREWAGRKFDSLSDEEGDFFYVTRLADGEPRTRKNGGGRKADNSKSNLTAALEASKQHLNGTASDGGEGDPVNPEQAADAILGGEPVVIAGGGAVMEEAQIITH